MTKRTVTLEEALALSYAGTLTPREIRALQKLIRDREAQRNDR